MSDYPTERGMRSNTAAQQGTGTGTGNTYGTGTDTYGTGTDTYGTGTERYGTGTEGTYGTGTGTTYNTNTSTNPQGTSSTYGTAPTTGAAHSTTSHHKYDFLNKLDPRQHGGSHTTGSEGREKFHASATSGPQIGGTDPSFGPGVTGVSTTDGGAGMGGAVAAGSSTGMAGAVPLGHAHKSEFLNKLDPRVDSKTGTWKPRRGSAGSGGSGGPVA